MTQRTSPSVDVVDLAPGLWIWRLEHPSWNERCDWQEVVTSVCVDTGGERWLLDPLLPPADATRVWDRLAERPPTAVAILIADHLRETWADREAWSIDEVVRRYGCRAYGPGAWDPDQGPPATEVHQIVPDHELPGGLRPLRDPRGWNETPLWIPEHRTLVFGDAMTERGGALRVWLSPTHQERALPDLRGMLDLPFERVIISHGEPVHGREAFERALDLPPWPATPLHQAAYGGNFDRVRQLVEAGADVTARDELHHGTALGWGPCGRAPGLGGGPRAPAGHLLPRSADREGWTLEHLTRSRRLGRGRRSPPADEVPVRHWTAASPSARARPRPRDRRVPARQDERPGVLQGCERADRGGRAGHPARAERRGSLTP